MDKNDTVYREPSAKEHFILAVMILLAFFILTSHYNPDILPSFAAETPTGAAATGIGIGSLAVWGIIMLLLIIGIIAGIILWWRNHRQASVQKFLEQEAQATVQTAEAARKSSPAVDPLTKKLTKVQQELIDIPLRSATTGHVINTIPSEYQKILKPPRYLKHLLPRKKTKVHKKMVPHHQVQHRESLQDKMMQIQKEIGKVKTRG